MYNQKIGISLANKYKAAMPEVLQIIKSVGFDAVSPLWNSEELLTQTVNHARELGLEIQSLHAPFNRAAEMWSHDPKISEVAKNELLLCIDACVKLDIPVMVVHAWIGFEYTFNKDSLNFVSFDEVVGYAEKNGVKIAFENTEGEEYLFALMEHFKDNDTVGYCWDSGHEMCYNFSKDLLAMFGDRLIMTHLNDNLGISRFDGKTYWTDDLHLLPYDGVADWDHNVKRLLSSRKMPILNFELTTVSKPNRHENDAYANMTLTEYFTEAYRRACRIAYKYSLG